MDPRQWYFNLISPFYGRLRHDPAEVAFVTEWFRPPAGARILDAGAGTGDHALVLARRFPAAKVTAIDFAGGFQRVGRRRVRLSPSNMEYVQGRLEALPFPAASFDAGLCLIVLWAIPERERALREFARVLAPGATVIVAEFVGTPGRRVRLPFGRPFVDEVELLDALSPSFENMETKRRGSILYVRCQRRP